MALALKPAHHGCNDRHGRGIAVQEFAGLGNIAGDAFGFLHHRPALGQFFLFTVTRRERFQFLNGRAQVIRLARRRLHLGAVRLQSPVSIFPGAVEALNSASLIAQPGKGIQQRPVCIGVDKRAIIMLAVDFDQELTELAHHLHADGLIIDIGLGAPVRGLHPAENQVAIVIETVFAQEKPGRVIVRDFESGSNLPLFFTVAHKAAVATAAKRQRETIEKNGFARTRLARQHGKACLETEVKPFDQNDIANRELDQHGLCPGLRRR
ncbi:hypothetical protein D3C72_1018610 [compost metagenome]